MVERILAERKPRWSRRAEARPAEIVEAAIDLFIDKGFAATRLDDVAALAGVAKGTLYRYFDTKEDLFKAVVDRALSPNLQAIEQAAGRLQGPFAETVSMLLVLIMERMAEGRVPAILRMVLADSRTFPGLARIWHDEVISRVLNLLTGLITAAQAEGEATAGDANIHALSLVGPFVAALLFREAFGTDSPYAADPGALATQHATTILRGMAR